MKLSAAQQHVIDRMREGWALCRTYGFFASAWLQEGGCGRGGKTEPVIIPTFLALYKKGLIDSQDDGSCWRLKR